MSPSDHPDEPARQEPHEAIESRKTGKRRRVLERVAAVTAVVVTLALVSGSLFVYVQYRQVWHSIKRQDVSSDLIHIKHAPPLPPPDPAAVNILLIGSDSRSGENGTIGGRDGIGGQRSDTVMVLHIAPGAHRAVVLSFPRDSVVPVYSCTAEQGSPGQTAAPGEIEQINATFAYGGPGCLWKTIEETTHIHINDFIELTFVGFEKIIDDLGGVSVCLPEAVDDPTSQLNLSAGRHRIYGSQALAFWRTREGVGSGMDTERIQRDQFLMAALLQGIENSGLLTSATKMASVVGDVASHMATDSQLTQSGMLNIAKSLRGLSSKSVQFIEVPWELYPGNINWVQWQQPEARALFSSITHDTKLPSDNADPGSTGNPGTASQPVKDAGSELSTGDSAALEPGQATSSPASLSKTYGGIRGNVSICQDKKAFSAADIGH